MFDTEDVSIAETAIDRGPLKIGWNWNWLSHWAALRSGAKPIAVMIPNVSGRLRDVVGLAPSDAVFQNFAGCFPVIVDHQLKFAGWDYRFHEPPKLGRWGLDAPMFWRAAAGNVGPLDLGGVFDKLSSGPPQGGGKKCQQESGDCSQPAMIVFDKVTAAFDPNLGVSNDPGESEETILFLLIASILLVPGLAGLKAR